MAAHRMPCAVKVCAELSSAAHDCLIVVAESLQCLSGELAFLGTALTAQREVDKSVDNALTVLRLENISGKRLVYSPTGPVNRDYDDVRRYSEAATSATKRALAMGSVRPLLVVPSSSAFKHAKLMSVLGALHALYVPLEVREAIPTRASKVSCLGVWTSVSGKETPDGLVKLITALESGRGVARDIGGSDPERMAAPRVAEYVQQLFKGSSVSVNVVSDVNEIERDFPLLAAVNRATKGVPRHQARLIQMEYTGEGATDLTLMLVGKGVTYDTGGADIKAGGVMAGMHRDKCGSAAVAGFFQTLNVLRPRGVRVIGAMCMVRNSVGSECYVADELMASRAGKRVRVGNTDAEGRMAMTDVLCWMKERATSEGLVNPYLFTIATLTGHAVRAMGPNYSIVMDNGPANKDGVARKLFNAGEEFADPFEISTIRREDYEFNKGKAEYEDLVQANNAPSTMTARGHQIPAAFMIEASGLEKHGIDSEKPLRYSHIDIAGSSGPFPGIPTGAPLLALANAFLLDRVTCD